MDLPNEAFDRRKELTHGEFELYQVLCKYRCWKRDTPDFGLAFPGRDLLCKELSMVAGYVSSLMSSLVRKKWMEKQGSKCLLLVGFEKSESQNGPDMSESQKVRIPKKKSQNFTAKKSEFDRSHIKELEVLEDNKTAGASPFPKTETDHQALMRILSEATGKIPDGAAQGHAVKWLIEAGYSREECERCLDQQLSTAKMGFRVSWLTVKSGIGSWKAQSQRGQQKPAITASDLLTIDWA